MEPGIDSHPSDPANKPVKFDPDNTQAYQAKMPAAKGHPAVGIVGQPVLAGLDRAGLDTDLAVPGLASGHPQKTPPPQYPTGLRAREACRAAVANILLSML